MVVMSIAATLTACAEGARPEGMAFTNTFGSPVAAADAGYKAYRVSQVEGGSETNPLWMSSVSSADFQSALESSLRSLGLLSDDPSHARVEITADLQKLQRPLVGIDLSVTSTVHYSARRTVDQKIIFDDTVAATGTAKFGDALYAVRRLQLANEAAMKENIEAFIERLRKSLYSPTVPAN